MNTHPQNDRRRAPQGGFTLVEIMVVVVILGLLGTLVVGNVIGMSDEARLQKAQTDAQNIWSIAKQYRLFNKRWPTLEQLTQPDDKGKLWIESYSKDPWDNDYEIRELDGGRIEVISYGVDGSPDTEDDITTNKVDQGR